MKEGKHEERESVVERIRWSWCSLVEWMFDRPYVLRNAREHAAERFRRVGWAIEQRRLDMSYVLRIRLGRLTGGQWGRKAWRLEELRAELDARGADLARAEAALAAGRAELELRAKQVEKLGQSLSTRIREHEELERQRELVREGGTGSVEQPEGEWWEKQLGGDGSAAPARLAQRRAASRRR